MHENDRPVAPGELTGAKRIKKHEPGDVQPFPGRDVGEDEADRRPAEKAPGKARGPSQEEPLTNQPPVEGP